MNRYATLTAAAGLLAGALPATGQTPARCPAGQEYQVDFGIQGLTSRNMEFHVRTVDGVRRRDVTFGAEPTVTAVRSGGPAEGRLRAGDVIVAIDGSLITTRAAGERWSSVRAGEDVTFTVRRQGREEVVAVVSDARCVTPSPAPPAPEPPRAVGAVPPPTAVAPGAPPPPTAAGASVGRAPRAVVEPGAPPAPVAAVAPAAPPPPAALPEGWFGFSIRCSECGVTVLQGGGEPIYTFSSPPEVRAVEPGTPAAEAGLEPGDLVVAIDGIGLTTEDGGRAFGAVEPGQTVRLTVRRGARAMTFTMRAIAREPRDVATELLRYRTGALPSLPFSNAVGSVRVRSDSLRYTGEVVEYSGGNASYGDAGWRVSLTRAVRDSAAGRYEFVRTLRYSGRVGNAVVEVRGGPSVTISEVRPNGDVIIRVGDTEVRVTTGAGGG